MERLNTKAKKLSNVRLEGKRMFRSLRTNFLVLISLCVIASALGCGGASNNDQGTSFTATGFFNDDGSGRSGFTTVLFSDLANPVLGGGDGQIVFSNIGVQNNLSNQFIRIVRVDCSYEIPGGSVTVPDDSQLIPGIVEALGGQALIGFALVSTDIFSFLNNNQNFLPQLPFRMFVTCSVTGVTQAGDTITTNPISARVNFVDQTECCPGEPNPGFQIGTGSGGTINFEQDTGTGNSTTLVLENTGSDTGGDTASGGTEGGDAGSGGE